MALGASRDQVMRLVLGRAALLLDRNSLRNGARSGGRQILLANPLWRKRHGPFDLRARSRPDGSMLEICALTDTLILDEEGLYDPTNFNDRLLLGLKGAMSEAELHVMQARMRGALLSKARRGELHVPLPIGFVYDAQGQVVLDPDQQVQESIRFLFQSFRRLSSASAVVRVFREAKLLFPRRLRGGPQNGELLWQKLDFGEHSVRVA